MNKFSILASSYVDEYGIDPLKDKVLNGLNKITSYSLFTITVIERGKPDLISYNSYGTHDFWWHIMAYNGIGYIGELVEGLQIKIPDYQSLVALSSEVGINRSERNSTRNTVQI